MKKRIFRNMFLLALAAVLLTTLLQGALGSRVLYGEMRQQLRTEAVYLRQGLADGGLAYLRQVTDGSDVRVTLIEPDGSVRFDSDLRDVGAAENHGGRPEVTAARQNGSGEAVRDSATLGRRTFYYAQLLPDGRVLRLSHTFDSLWRSVLRGLPYTLLCTGVLLLLALFLSRRQVRRIVSPLNNLDLEHPLQNDVYDELSPLLQRVSQQNTQIRDQLRELSERQQEFDTLTAHMDEGMVIVNAYGYILSVNRRALQIFGLPEGDYLQKHILVVNRNLRLQKLIEQGLKGEGGELSLELEGRCYQVMASPIRLQGLVRGLVILLLDVTEKAQREQLRREFTANVSHELRTPLTAISGYAEIMAQGLVQPEDMRPFAEKIYSEANRLITLVADIMQLSQLDEGAAQFLWEPVALDDLAAETARRLEPLAGQNGVTVATALRPVTVTGVRAVLQEICYNLCENAVKYNHPGGHVRLSVAQAQAHAVLTVEDDGAGIPPEEQPQVFERFYRVDKSHSRQVEGTGLGLPIVKHGVQLHRGEVTLESAPGAGTRVTVRLPLAPR